MRERRGGAARADAEGERRHHQRPTTRVALVPVASTRATRTGKQRAGRHAAEDQPRAVGHPHREIAGAADVERAGHRREVAARRRGDRRPVLGRCGQAAGMPAEAVGHRGPSRLAGDGPRARARPAPGPLAVWECA